jgi:hypothetical protein
MAPNLRNGVTGGTPSVAGKRMTRCCHFYSTIPEETLGCPNVANAVGAADVRWLCGLVEIYFVV